MLSFIIIEINFLINFTMKIDGSPKTIEEILSSRYIEKIWPSKVALKRFLASGRRLTIYIGIDPTGPKLHLGHSTNFLLLKKFQQLGHKVVFLTGDFTAQIGDPTGRLSLRKAMLKKDILYNCKSYEHQAGRILDFYSKENPVEIKFNSRWLSKLTFEKIIGLTSKITIGKLIKRDMFQKRIKEGKEIYLHEFLYPLLQGYDSVALNADIEIGGNDQTFNMLIGRDLVKIYQKREKLVIATKLLVNPKTKKKLMSKSEGNFIALDNSAPEIYGKVMALPDEVIITCFELCTEVPGREIQRIEKLLKMKKINPAKVKAKLAQEIVALYHGEKSSKIAKREFEQVFKKKKVPSKMPIFIIPHKFYPLVNLLIDLKFAKSKSEAKRLILQKGVEIDGKVMEDCREKVTIKEKMVIKVGKRRFAKINIK